MTGSRSRSPEKPAFRRTAAGMHIPSGVRVEGRLAPPPSKSLTHRAFNLALLANQPLRVERPLVAEDTALFREALRRLGWRVEDAGEAVELTPGLRPASAEIDCGNAGTMFRFLTASLATIPGAWRLDGVPRLRERPVGPLVDALRALGADIECPGREGYAPLVVWGGRLTGERVATDETAATEGGRYGEPGGRGGRPPWRPTPARGLAGGRVALDAGVSSQFLSALLMAATVAAGEVEIVVEQLTSHPYVDLTLDLLARFGAEVEATATGYRVQPRPLASPGAYRVEGDFSAAAYPAAAAALTGGRVTLTGLPRDSRQGDRGFLDLLAAMGARVTWQGADEVEVAGTGTLSALDVDLSSMPDQVPTLVALAPFARGTTRIRGVPHLRVKESDRLAAMAEGLRALGAAVEERPDGLVIPGVWAEERPPVPAAPIAVDPRGDHRIAMSLAVAGLGRGGVVITDPEVVGKSYPAFGDDLAGLLHRAEGLGARE